VDGKIKHNHGQKVELKSIKNKTNRIDLIMKTKARFSL